MNKRILLAITALLLVTGFLAIASAKATTINVNLGDKATMTVTPTNPNVNFVGFTWTDPSGTTRVDNQECWSSPFESTQTLDVLGTWHATAYLADYSYPTYNLLETQETTFEVRSPTLNTIPEIPIIGTLGITLVMALCFAAFAIIRKRTQPKST